MLGVAADASALIVKCVRLGGVAYGTKGAVPRMEMLVIGVGGDGVLVVKIAADTVSLLVIAVRLVNVKLADGALIAMLGGDQRVA